MAGQDEDTSAQVIRDSASRCSPERWQRIKDVLAGALELQTGERDGFLEQACGDDRALRREVESLLAAASIGETTSAVFADLIAAAVPQGLSSSPNLYPGTRLGDYERVDLRVNRDVATKNGRMSFYLEVTNLLDRKNPCCVEARHETRGTERHVVFGESNWLPMLPSFGIQYEF